MRQLALSLPVMPNLLAACRLPLCLLLAARCRISTQYARVLVSALQQANNLPFPSTHAPIF